MSQIALPFDWQDQGGFGHFLTSEANRLALEHVQRWREWPLPISILSGPPRSGKSLLGRYFQSISGGMVIEDANGQPDEALFHRWNLACDSDTPLLLIAREEPCNWTVALSDLRSRLAAAPHVRIEEPDDVLIGGLIEAGLARGGSAFSPDLPEWLTRRTERSYVAIERLLIELNGLSLASSRKISVLLAKEALQKAGFLPIEEQESAPHEAHPLGRNSTDDV